jgi:hypothetical protein
MAGTSSERVGISVFYGVAGGILAAVVLAGLCVWFIFRTHPAAGDGGQQQPVYSRAEFKSKVLGKTEEEVSREMGPPDFTSQDSETLYWHYRNRTRDPAGKGPDTDAQVVFHHGKVDAVNY